MTKKRNSRSHKLTTEQRKAIWKNNRNRFDVVGSNTNYEGGRAPIRSMSDDPSHAGGGGKKE